MYMNINKKFDFNSYWLTGFTQADGSFVVNFEKKTLGKIPYYPRPAFVLTQSINEKDMMRHLHKYLNVGNIRMSRNDISIVVRSLDELTNTIIPHFCKYPLYGEKGQAFKVLVKVVSLIKAKAHLEVQGFMEILDISFFMNKTSLRTKDSYNHIVSRLNEKKALYREKFIAVSQVKRNSGTALPLVKSTCALDGIDGIDAIPKIEAFTLNAKYLTGLIDGDGSFNFGFKTSRLRVEPNFTITMELKDKPLLEKVQTYFNCGGVYTLKSNAARYQVNKAKDIAEKIIPLLENFNTKKKEHLPNITKALAILSVKGRISEKHLIEIVSLVYNLNHKGKARKMTRESYLNKHIKNINLRQA